MTESAEGPTPPEGLPESLIADLDQLDPEQLRKTIIYVRELLQASDEADSPIEPTPGEDIIRVTEHDGYTEVVKQVRCADGCSDCPHGPYLYHVTEEPRPEGGTHTHWSLLGRVEIDEE